MPKMFEREYAEKECVWGLSPDPLLVTNKEIPVGEALDLGSGEGRNALFLAENGFRVTGIDMSSRAIMKFLDIANERKLRVEGLVMDIRNFEFRPSAYNLIVASHILHFFGKKEVNELVSKIIRSLVPGGYVYIVDFTVSDPSYKVAKKRLKQTEENTFYSPKLSSHVHFFSHNEMKKMFDGFEMKAYKEEVTLSPGHGEIGPHKHEVVLLFAKKRGSD